MSIKLILVEFLEFFFSPLFPESFQNDRYISKTLQLYKKDKFTEPFTKLRFWDAPFREIEIVVPRAGKIVDLGCGDGVFTNCFALTGPQRMLTGIELNKERIVEADKGLKNTRFIHADVLKKNFFQPDVFLMIHLLHHLLSRTDQEKLIKKCSKTLKKGGKLVVVEVDVKPTFKYLVSWLTDHFVVPILFEGKIFESKIYFRKKEEWLKVLKENGFSCKVVSAEKGKPFSHVIFDCTKVGY